MRWVKPEVFLIAKTVIQDREVQRWLTRIGCSDEVAHKYSNVDFIITEHGGAKPLKTNTERLIELAGRRCYLSFEPGLNPNITKIREDITEYLTNILKSGHGSVLEHCDFSFSIEGGSRVFTGEMNRHRAGVAISEGSMRYIRYNDIPIVEVNSLIPDDPDPEINKLIEEDRADFEEHARFTEKIYMRMTERWKAVLASKDFTKKKHLTSRMRRIIPMGVATGGVWTFNVRSLRHMLTMRAAEAAEEEIALVAGKILEIMMIEEPVLFGDFKMQENGFYKPEYVKV